MAGEMQNNFADEFAFSVAAISETGRVRKQNEDYVGYHVPSEAEERRKRGVLLVVCDGVGGGAAGEVASEYAVRRILSDYYKTENGLDPQNRLLEAIQQANWDIYDENAKQNAALDMACTVVTVLVLGQQALLAHAGDSRAYIIRGGQVIAMTNDHSWVARMVASGDLTATEAEAHPWRNRITRSLGLEERVQIETQTVALSAGDTIVLCSDGLSKSAANKELAGLVAEYPPQEAARRLVDLANERGGKDNISVIVAALLPPSD